MNFKNTYFVDDLATCKDVSMLMVFVTFAIPQFAFASLLQGSK